MKREEFLLGASLYALFITIGFSGPVLKTLAKLPWNKPVGSFDWSFFNPSIPTAQQKAIKKILASRVRKVLTGEKHLAASKGALDPIHQKLKENWEQMSSQSSESKGKVGPAEFFHPVLGGASGLKLTPVTPERKAPHGEEPTRG